MKTVNAPVQIVHPFHVAIGLWGDLTKHQGLHWNCGDGEDAIKAGWWAYDRYQRPKPPPLHKRYKRVILTDIHNELYYTERINYLKLIHYFMSDIAQGAVVISTQFTTTDDIMKMCKDAGFAEVKRIQEGCVLIHKY